MNNFMKKVSSILAVLFVTTSFTGCFSNNSEVAEDVTVEVEETNKEEKKEENKQETNKKDEEQKTTQEKDSNKKEEKQENKKEETVKKETPKNENKITVVENCQSMLGVVTANSLNLRANSNTSSNKIGSVSKGNLIPLKEKLSNGWYKVYYAGKEAYISGEYIERKESVERYLIKNINNGAVKRGEKVTVKASNGKIVCSTNQSSFTLSVDEARNTLSVTKPEDKKPETNNNQQSGTQVATFSTYYDASQKGRSQNLALASKAISVTLQPGEEFVWSRIVGQASADKGYKEAPVFSGNKVVPGVGGGVCQVSTTLYNAVLNAGFQVTERHPHSMPVTYAKPGRDAAVAYGSLDFRFINTADYAIKISANAAGGTLTVTIYKA